MQASGGFVLQKPIYEVKIITDFAAAHNLRNFRGKCENLHGHNWKVEVVIRGDKLNESGVLVDFGEVKLFTRELLAELDHKYLNDIPFFKDANPSSENIARFISEGLAKKIDKGDRKICSVSAWESADACATYITEWKE
jgi:6-pyruvoyltetrahydropterin/6-carboxytetrahydropterin synthase